MVVVFGICTYFLVYGVIMFNIIIFKISHFGVYTVVSQFEFVFYRLQIKLKMFFIYLVVILLLGIPVENVYKSSHRVFCFLL